MKTMSTIKNGFVLMLLSLAAPAAFAGPGDRGGGNAVICKDDEGRINKVQVLDYFEARLLNSIKIDLGAPALDYRQKIEIALSRLQARDGDLARRLRASAAEFEAGTSWITGADLTPVPDSRHIFMAHKCEAVQIALQKVRKFPGEKIYYVNKEVWDLMDNDSRAGLVLHEILYRRAREQGAEDSTGARYFNSVISSADMLGGFTDLEYATLLKESQIQGGSAEYPLAGFRDGVYTAYNAKYHANGALKWASFRLPFKVTVAGRVLRATDGAFSESGEPTMVNLEDPAGVSLTFRYQDRVYASGLKARDIELDARGRVVSGTLAAPVSLGGFSVHWVRIDEAGLLSAAKIAEGEIPAEDAASSRMKIVFLKEDKSSSSVEKGYADSVEAGDFPYCPKSEEEGLYRFRFIGGFDEVYDVLPNGLVSLRGESSGAKRLRYLREKFTPCPEKKPEPAEAPVRVQPKKKKK